MESLTFNYILAAAKFVSDTWKNKAKLPMTKTEPHLFIFSNSLQCCGKVDCISWSSERKKLMHFHIAT